MTTWGNNKERGSIMITDVEIRQFARAGARLEAVKIVTEFPDILPELNQLAQAPKTNGHAIAAPRRAVSAASRKKIAAGQRKRWAAWRKRNGKH